MVINRLGIFYLIETKNYAGNVLINSHGEFTAQYDEDQFGVPSPIEQSRRHERILRRLLGRLEITARVGTSLEFHHVVMFHPKAIISRPPAKEFDTSSVIKADQFPSWHSGFVHKMSGVGMVLRGIANVRSLETAKDWGEKLMRQHRPAKLLELPQFMVPVAPKVTAPLAAVPRPIDAPTPQVAGDAPAEAGARRLICLHCNSKISFPEGKYCWNNSARFKGGQYCREHQALF